MANEKYLTYRGDVKAIAGAGSTLAFVTVHPEGQPVAVYRLDADKLILDADALPCGGAALAADGDTLWVAGSDGHTYQAALKGGPPRVLGDKLPSPPTALALLSKFRLAVLAGSQVAVLSRKDGMVLQTLELTEAGTVLAAEPGGQWLAAGTVKGIVSVFECEDKDEFQLSESQKIHEGAVTALLFEQDDLRFFSAGADQKLFSTHARGKLEPEERGRGAGHTEPITALVWAPGDRFLSGSRDKTVKTWPRTGNVRPATLKDNVGKVVALATVQVHNRTFLAVACDDNTLRFFLLDAAGKFGEMSSKVHGALDWAKFELGQNESSRREAALKALAEWSDTASVELLADQIGGDADHGLRLLATQLLAGSSHPRVPRLLEPLLKHDDEAVRVAALAGLRKHLGEQDLRPLDLALKTDKADVGRLAIQAMETLAAKDDQALARLNEALNANTLEVRQAALASLEKVHAPDSPEANLIALGSKYADLRRLTLVRLYQRHLLQHAKALSALRWRMEDADAEVRRTAFLLSLHTRERLVAALRARDPELQRQLLELEGATQQPAGEVKKEKPAPATKRKTERKQDGSAALEEADYAPLLQATASRALDTCLRGARGLAVLGDVRAFGLLLQLSREEDTAARVEVCRALAALDDPRSINRLRSLLYDAEPAVRDAAFSALVHIHQDDPLLGAESGLSAAFEDVRRRGLQVLITDIRKTPPAGAADRSWQLLLRALNDSADSVRGEAFKAALNQQLAGGGIGTLRFVLQSVHADIRREVLTEVMAQVNEPWAWNLLLEFYNDHEPQLRTEAFEFATKKNKELPPLEAALQSQYADVRRLAVEGLVKKHTKPAQALLVKALADREKEVRQLALDSLVGGDAQGAMTEALKSPHADVRVRAARVLARHGSPAALPPLLALATAPEPEEQERKADWAALVEQALAGLAELGEPAALTGILPLLDSRRADLRLTAAHALVWVSRPDSPEAARSALQHADPQVKYRAALALAYCGDPMVSSLVFSAEAAGIFSAEARLIAALTLGPAGEDQLIVFLDDADETVRNQALLLLMMLDLRRHQGTPARCLACLSSRVPRVRLTAAHALEAFADPAALARFVVQLLNERGDEQPWLIAPETALALADLIAFGQPQTRARTAQLLRHLSEKEQAAWDQAWLTHAGRFAAEITAVRQEAEQHSPPASQYSTDQLRELAFGAYVGLVREQGAARGQRGAGQQVARVRQTALSRILALARASEHHARAAVPVFIQALGDPNQPVRLQAFEQLQALGFDPTALGAEALEAGHTDLGVKGLELLSAGAVAGQGQTVLQQVMLSRNDGLSIEAAKLLMPQRGAAAVAAQALEAVHEELRSQAVGWLAAEYEKDSTAKDELRRALQSRYQKVRDRAALELATKKDPSAYDALVKQLQTVPTQPLQRRLLGALVTLGDPRTPDAFMDRVENDPSGTALPDELLKGAGSFRRPENADRLLALAEKNTKWRKAALEAVLAISGYDQQIGDLEDERPDRRWLEQQFPRHDAILVKLIERCQTLGDVAVLKRLVPGARWAHGNKVEPALAMLTAHPDDQLRQAAVEAVGWRLRKRQGGAESLLRALQHRDPQTQFLAAEGLARAGRGEGLSVLLSAVEFLTNFYMRQRAVAALGELADARALDTLLKLANEPGHVLQSAAAEALGHLGRSEQAEEIFRLLERFAKGTDELAGNALRGLRWLNTHAGWQLIRKKAGDFSFLWRPVAVQMLGYNDDPATRDLLLKLLATDQEILGQAFQSARQSARLLWGQDALEPDYALLQNAGAVPHIEPFKESLRRMAERGESKRLFEILPRCQHDMQEQLALMLLHRRELPVAEAQAALDSADERTAQLAAQVLGRAGSAKGKAAAALESAVRKWRELWEQRRRKMAQESGDDEHLLRRTRLCLQALLWAAGRLGLAQDELIAAATARADDPYYRPVRLEAVEALADGKMTEPVLAVLEKVALDNDSEVRTVAADALGRHAARRAAALAKPLLSDQVSFNRLARNVGVDVTETTRKAAGQVHYQGVALPYLVVHGDVEAVSAVAHNRALPEATRLGAVEALAKLGLETAEAELVRLCQAEKEDEELRKAAWRGLRRSKRARQKVAR